MSSAGIAYNQDDPVQARFLSSLALGETGNSAFASSEGFGGTNLGGVPTDSFGFPQWSGVGNTHAAGTYQFQPGTWDSIAQQFGLNFSNPGDQNAGAWYLAQQTFAQNTGGQDLESALQAGNFQQVQSALAGVWPSVTGNQAAPQGLANDLASGLGSPNVSQTAPSGSTSNPGSPAAGSSGGSSSGDWVTAIEDFFVRGGLIIIGGLVILVAIWALLSNAGVVPGPGKVAKAAVKAL